MKIGIICPSEIALRRFMPALLNIKELEFAGIGVCNAEEMFGNHPPAESIVREVLDKEHEKAAAFTDAYGGKIYESYEAICTAKELDCLYIPLPPALHFKWAKKALSSGKHVLVEKPSTVSYEDTAALTKLAEEKGLALHENYMFAFHNQLSDIDEIIKSGEIGEVRLYRIAFGFPRRSAGDFRYNKDLGGGALIDAGGYTLKYASMLLGEGARVRYAQMNYTDEFEVDMYGSAALSGKDGVCAQISFGMDNNYKCELEVWGSKGTLYTGRVLTAPVGFVPEVVIRKGNEDEKRPLRADDAFGKSIRRFLECMKSAAVRVKNYEEIQNQARLVDEFRQKAEEK